MIFQCSEICTLNMNLHTELLYRFFFFFFFFFFLQSCACLVLCSLGILRSLHCRSNEGPVQSLSELPEHALRQHGHGEEVRHHGLCVCVWCGVVCNLCARCVCMASCVCACVECGWIVCVAGVLIYRMCDHGYDNSESNSGESPRFPDLVNKQRFCCVLIFIDADPFLVVHDAFSHSSPLFLPPLPLPHTPIQNIECG